VQFKNYIALFFVVVFLARLATVDTNSFELLLSSSGVTMVNKMCPKKQLLKNASEKLSPETAAQEVEMNFLCHTVFDHETTEWKIAMTGENFQQYTYQAPGIFSPPTEKFYPPPKA
jgi:hypothetical protein